VKWREFKLINLIPGWPKKDILNQERKKIKSLQKESNGKPPGNFPKRKKNCKFQGLKAKIKKETKGEKREF